MAGNGFTVLTDELHGFSRYLDGTTGPAVRDAAKAVEAANGADTGSFGVLLAQVLAVPARIALQTATDNLHGVARDVTKTSDSTKKAAAHYTAQDEHLAAQLGGFKAALGG